MKKRAVSLLLMMAMLFVFVPFQNLEVSAASSTAATTIDTAYFPDMLARAEAVVNYTWTPRQDISTWNNSKYNGSTVFQQGTTVKGMPYTLFTWELMIDSLLSLEQYKAVTDTNYTAAARCWSVSGNALRIGPAYGSCCATFVSEVLGGSFMNGKNPRYDSVYGIQESPYAQHILNAKASQIQVGDALSTKVNASHVIWVGGITDTSYIIYEQTPPVARKVVVDKASHTDANGYFWYGTSGGNKIYYKTINRVNVVYDKDTQAPAISDVKVSSVTGGEGYTVSCKVTDNVGVTKVQFPTWSETNGQDDLAKDWETSSAYAGKKDGDTYTYTVKISDHNNDIGKYLTHIYAWDEAGNKTSYTKLAAVDVTDIPLTITTQPKDAYGNVGDSVMTYVKAKGRDVTYQWQLSDDEGQTWRNSSVKTSYYYTTLTEQNSGRYLRCIVTDKYGNKVTSNAAVMGTAGELTITAQPTDVVAKSGAWITFKVSAKGEGLTYQWQLSDDGGKTWRNSSIKKAQYSVTLTDKNNGRYVRCIVTDKSGSKVTSHAASMKLTTLKITTQPKNSTVNLGDTASFKIAAEGEGLKYQWQLSDDQGKTWRNSKATGTNYSAVVTDSTNGRYVRCVVTDQYGVSVKTNAAIMKATVFKITVQPESVTAEAGGTAAFKVKAEGSGLTYQWQLSDDEGKTWRNSKATGAYYSAALTDANNGRYVRCIITDKYGNKLTSDAAYMKIAAGADGAVG